MSPKEIAEYFRKEGVKGIKNSTDRCPVASYILSKAGSEAEYASTHWASTSVWYSENQRVEVAHPGSIKAFVMLFDAGQFPFLERGY